MQPTIDVENAVARGFEALLATQHADGRFEGEMVWNAGLSAQYVLASCALGLALSPPGSWTLFLRSTQRADGSWPLHREGEGYVYITFLAYLALRVLGQPASDPSMQKALAWFHDQGGLAALPIWGKFWAALFGLVPWRGVAPLTPEMFLLPDSFVAHPRRFYAHTRRVYLAMSYLFGRRARFSLGDIDDAVQAEMRVADLAEKSSHHLRHAVARGDLYEKPHWLVARVLDGLSIWERICPKSLRQKSLQRVMEMTIEDLAAADQMSLSPVEGILNALVLHTDGRDPTRPWKALDYWILNDATGQRVVGARSGCWDTAFVLRAMKERGTTDVAAVKWLNDACIDGGWSFSGREHPWLVSDCTAEAVSGLNGHAVHAPDATRAQDAARVILARRNDDGGFGSFAKRGAPRWLGRANVSQMFGSCMIESSYVECTASSIGGLMVSLPALTPELAITAQDAINGGIHFLRRAQKPDGAYRGAWGICYTYAIFMAVEGLTRCHVPLKDPAIVRALNWLESRQAGDGSFGEHWTSGKWDNYRPHERGQPTMTAWALLALCAGGRGSTGAAKRAAAFLMRKQQPDGTWPTDAQAGVFFRSGVVDYLLYKDLFPTWALTRFSPFATGKK